MITHLHRCGDVVEWQGAEVMVAAMTCMPSRVKDSSGLVS